MLKRLGNASKYRHRVTPMPINKLGTDFFRFHRRSDPILSVPNEMESATGLNSLSGQLTIRSSKISGTSNNPSEKQKQKRECCFSMHKHVKFPI